MLVVAVGCSGVDGEFKVGGGGSEERSTSSSRSSEACGVGCKEGRRQWHVIACNFHHVPLGFGEMRTLSHVHLQELHCLLQNPNTRAGKKSSPTDHCPFASRRY
jgi:hypothetical protein